MALASSTIELLLEAGTASKLLPYSTVAPVLPSASLIVLAAAWTPSAWNSPATTTERPLWAWRILGHRGHPAGDLGSTRLGHAGGWSRRRGAADGCRGGTDVLTQASVLNLLRPRSLPKTITFRGRYRAGRGSWARTGSLLRSQKPPRGGASSWPHQPITSPSLAALLGERDRAEPRREIASLRCLVARGPGRSHGSGETAVYQFDKADVIVALDADFLTCGAGNVRYSKDFSARRRLTEENTSMNRLYAIESTPTLTGAKANHRLSIAASEVEAVARELAAAIGGAAAPAPSASVSQPGAPEVARWVAAIAKDLQAHKGRSVVVAGEFQTDGVHAAAKAINDALGNTGTTVLYGSSAEAVPASGRSSIVELARAIDAGQVELLVIMGGNPVFTAPVDLRFADRLAKVPIVAYHTTHLDETSALCHWNVAETHALESWGDSQSFEGTVTVTQPLIEPLYEGQSAHDFIAAFTSQPGRRGLALVKDFWTRTYSTGTGGWKFTNLHGEGFPNPEAFWRTAVHDGFIAGTSFAEGGPVTTLTAPAAAAPPATPGATARPGRRRLQRRPLRARRRRPRRPRPPLHRRRSSAGHRAVSRSSSGPIRRSGTAASRTTAGCRNCPSPTRRSPGTPPRGSASGSQTSAGCARETSSSCDIAATPCGCRCSWCRAIPRSR